MSVLQNRYDFILFFDVIDGNPNGDPDAGNLPRMDPETNQGLVSDVAIKRKIRNYVAATHSGESGYEIYVTEGAVLNEQHQRAYSETGKDSKDKTARKPAQEWMCKNFFDIRTFGAVMSTEVNCGQVRGPVQISFARSQEPILPLEVSITRLSVTKKEDRDKERTMGRKHIVPYGLYRVHGFINPKLAEKTGFSEDDLQILWKAFQDMLDMDRSAARGEMTAHRLIAFRHDSALGNAQAHKLFDRVKVHRRSGDELIPVGDERTHNIPSARSFHDYEITMDSKPLPEGIKVIEPFC